MMSPRGLSALMRREGVVLKMYLDSAGLPTIGVGHLLTKDELHSGKIAGIGDWHNGLTDAQVQDLLTRDLMRAESTVNRLVKVPLTINQRDALLSFVFNVGGGAFADSTLLKVLNTGDYESVPAQLRRWIHAAGQRNQGLAARREDEIIQWKRPDE